jgi:hypothetical protein
MKSRVVSIERIVEEEEEEEEEEENKRIQGDMSCNVALLLWSQSLIVAATI